MRKLFISAALLLLGIAAGAQDKLTFTPQWTPQAQFAGFYVALEKGYYSDEMLDVEILHVGVNSSETPHGLLMSGTAQIAGLQLLQAMTFRADGEKIVNVMQLSQHSGLMCISHTPVSSAKDLNGKKIGRWQAGFSEICDIITGSEGLNLKWIPFVGDGVSLYVYKAVDATLAYSYSEYIQLQFAKGAIPEENILNFSKLGYDYPEDGLYVLESYYNKNKDKIDRFVKATKRGWDYARKNKAEALSIVKKYTEKYHVVTNSAVQSKMLDEYLKLQEPSDGKAFYSSVDEKTFNKMVNALHDNGVITNEIKYGDLIR